ncbi:MAG: fibronectin type III domain-containing protein, partial [Candidatus Polarisedimenticolia bacterium]
VRSRSPIRLAPAAARELRVRQVGGEVVLTAILPGTRTDGSPLPRPVVRIMRMQTAPTFSLASVSRRYLLRQFEKEAATLATLSGEALAAAAPGGRLVYRDAIAPGAFPDAPDVPLPAAPPAAATPGVAAPGSPAPRGAAVPRSGPRHLYSVLIHDPDEKRSSLAMPVPLDLAPAPPAPRGLAVEAAEGELRLSWSPGEDSPPGLRFNVYRLGERGAGEPGAPLNPAPIDGTSWVDRTFRYGEACVYSVRAVASGEGPPRESAGTAPVRVVPRDVYPPKAPDGLAVAIEGGAIRLYWFPNEEADLRGYRIHRRAAGIGEEWRLVAEVDAAEPSWVEPAAAAGVRYDYRVTAFDSAEPPNESVPSAEETEMLSPAGEGGDR